MGEFLLMSYACLLSISSGSGEYRKGYVVFCASDQS
jgi:hypothetical protein